MFRMLVLGLLLLPLPAHAGIYKWTDAQGRVHFGDQPKDGQQAQEVEVKDYLPGSDARTREITERGQRLMSAGEDAKRQVEAREAGQAADTRALTAKRCQEAREYLRAVSGRVVFTDEEGREVKVSEQERANREQQARAWVASHCP